MEKIIETIEEAKAIVDENEKLIANILHDIKSPLFSIKIALQNNLNNELNKDVFETTLFIIRYIENFLTNYNFKKGKFENKKDKCDIAKIINQKIESYKYIFMDKGIVINFYCDNCDYSVNSIYIFLSSIIGNIISNIAFHATDKTEARIELEKKKDCVLIDFKNQSQGTISDSSLGLDFCRNLANLCHADFKLTKSKNSVNVLLKVPNLN